MEETLKEEIIDIKGMHCKSCTENIESKLSKLHGVEKTRISLVEEKAFVRFNPTKININEIINEIKNMGYKAIVSEGNTVADIPDNDKNYINDKPSKVSLKQGIVYGLIPHIGCIAFIIGSVLGVTILTQFFKPFLMNPYFFHILVVISIGFATISSALYLRKNGLLSIAGARRKWKYLSTMYGSTIVINLLLFLVIFPLLANISFAQTPTGNFLAGVNSSVISELSSLELQVDIPCSGHASLISGELKTINGVTGVQFSLPNIFDVKYDSSKTSKQQILALEVFKTYKATVLGESSNQQVLDQQATPNQQTVGGSCGGGGSGGCGCGG